MYEFRLVSFLWSSDLELGSPLCVVYDLFCFCLFVGEDHDKNVIMIELMIVRTVVQSSQ